MIHQDYPNFGINLRKLRQIHNYTICQLSEKLDVSVNLIAMYENGYRTPSLKMLSKISDLFHISIDALLNGNDSCNDNSIVEVMLGISKKQYDSLSEYQKKQIRQFVKFIYYYKDN